jgi:FkbM family methyltransferase
MKRVVRNFIRKTFSPKFYVAFSVLINRIRTYKLEIPLLFELLNGQSDKVYFIQIGANDGVNNDPINEFVKKFQWAGILVEPMPKFFEELKNNYQGQAHLTFENSGISDTSQSLNFYYLPEDFCNPSWLQQIGSFDKDAIEKNLEVFPELVKEIKTIQIPTLTLTELVKKYNVAKVDLLIVDAEGYEYKILSQIAQTNVRPSFIFFEWGCLADGDLHKTKEELSNLGYSLYTIGGDILAVY